MKTPTQKQIDAEIKKLEAMKSRISRTNFFGNNNHEKIDAQIKVLEENLSEDEVYAEFEDADNPDNTIDLVNDAREAALWLIGKSDEDETPSDGWKELVR